MADWPTHRWKSRHRQPPPPEPNTDTAPPWWETDKYARTAQDAANRRERNYQ